jgi:YHS domain-containing protein
LTKLINYVRIKENCNDYWRLNMSKWTRFFLVLSVVMFFVAITSYALPSTDEMVNCAVSGKEMKKSEAKSSMEYKGKTHYFCCDNCEKSFKENPEKYINGEHIHEHAEDMVVDPVCGMKVKKSDAKATYEYNGKTYYFCMEGCKEKFVKAPAKYVSADENKVTCPVSGSTFNKSDAAGSMEYKGKTYHFCCDNCKEKFEKDPEKYTKKK